MLLYASLTKKLRSSRKIVYLAVYIPLFCPYSFKAYFQRNFIENIKFIHTKRGKNCIIREFKKDKNQINNNTQLKKGIQTAIRMVFIYGSSERDVHF